MTKKRKPFTGPLNPFKRASNLSTGSASESVSEGAQGQPAGSTSRAPSLQSQVPHSTMPPSLTVHVPSNESSARRSFDFERVKDIDGLRELLEYMRNTISSFEEKKKSKIACPEVVKVNLEPSAKLLDRLATMCFPSSSHGLAKDIAGESRHVLKHVLEGLGNLHWIAAGFLILASILDRADQMNEIKEDCLRFVKDLLKLGDHIVTLFEDSDNDRCEQEKAKNEEKIGTACTFLAAGAALCFKHLNSKRWKRALFADTYKKEITVLKDGIDGVSRDLNLFATLQTHGMIKDIHGKVKDNPELLGRVKDTQERLKDIQRKHQSLDSAAYYYKPEYPKHKVGLEAKVSRALKKLGIEDETSAVAAEVQMILLHGMGGIGKSTLGDAICSKICALAPFRGRTFAEVEIGPNPSTMEICNLQQHIYQRLSGKNDKSVKTCREGRQVLSAQFRECLTSGPILLFIDNVFRMQDLRELLPDTLELPGQSRIILTSRDQAMLRDCLWENIQCTEYPVDGLTADQSMQIFERLLPLPLDVEDVKFIISKCEGLPLLLQIIGAHIRYMSNKQEVWSSLKRSLEEGGHLTGRADVDEKVDGIFSLSYDVLSPDTQELFLDICLLRGRDVEWVRSLDDTSRLALLENLSLVTQISSESTARGSYGRLVTTIQVHDRAVDFARCKSQGTRILLKEGKSIEPARCRNAEGLVGRCPERWPVMELDPLRILVLEDVDWRIIGKIPRQLQICSMHHDTVTPKPARLILPWLKELQCLEQLRVLDISYIYCQNLEEAQLPGNLQVLKLTSVRAFRNLHPNAFERCCSSLHTLHMVECPDFEMFPVGLCRLRNLVVLVLSCETLERFFQSHQWLSEDFCGLTSLQELDLGDCWSLKELPQGFGGLSALTRLILSGCLSLEQLSEDFCGLTSLQELDLGDCGSLKELPQGFGGLSALTRLVLHGCDSLEQLPVDFSGLTSLQELEASCCKSLKELPQGFGGLSALTGLVLNECDSLEQLPEDFCGLTSLQELDLGDCGSLKELPQGFGGLSALTRLVLNECDSLEQLPEDFSGLTSLQELKLRDCWLLKELPQGFGGLSALTRLVLDGCESLEQLPKDFCGLKSLQKLDLCSCQALKELPQGFGGLMALTRLFLSGCDSLEQLPKDFCGLTSLQELDLSYCRSLKELPQGFGGLSALTRLVLDGCESLEQLPKDFCGLKSLQKLDLCSCQALKELPQGFGGLMALTRLFLSGCDSLEQLPKDFCGLTSLQELDLSYCRSLKELPQGFGGLSALTRLILRWCASLEQLPEDFCGLTSLQELDARSCESLKELPQGFEDLWL